jgi:Zn-finger protein
VKAKNETRPTETESAAGNTADLSDGDLSRILFINRECPFFPCHDLSGDEWESCLFCFCPLYLTDCPGNPTVLENSVKDCTNCTFPHKQGAYKRIIKILRSLPAGNCRS